MRIGIIAGSDSIVPESLGQGINLIGGTLRMKIIGADHGSSKDGQLNPIRLMRRPLARRMPPKQNGEKGRRGCVSASPSSASAQKGPLWEASELQTCNSDAKRSFCHGIACHRATEDLLIACRSRARRPGWPWQCPDRPKFLHLLVRSPYLSAPTWTKNTTIALRDRFDSLVDRQVAKDRCGSASEVIRAGLRLLDEQLAALRVALIEGEQGRPSEPFDFDRFLNRNELSNRNDQLCPVSRCSGGSEQNLGLLGAKLGDRPSRSLGSPHSGCSGGTRRWSPLSG